MYCKDRKTVVWDGMRRERNTQFAGVGEEAEEEDSQRRKRQDVAKAR